ncbi:MAG TPA: hypothetical protein ENI23_16245 [bacterium]|nr:hypothetical protein [bacterium]
MNLHYFDNPEAAETDTMLKIVIRQGYVPPKCLLGGLIVLSLINEGKDPRAECNSDRSICRGRPIKLDTL